MGTGSFSAGKTLSVVLVQELCTQHSVGFGHFGEGQSAALDIYATSEL